MAIRIDDTLMLLKLIESIIESYVVSSTFEKESEILAHVCI